MINQSRGGFMTTITVCIGSSCHLKSSYDVVNEFQRLIKENSLEGRVTIKASFCFGKCTQAVCVKIDDGDISSVNKENIESFFEENVLKKNTL